MLNIDLNQVHNNLYFIIDNHEMYLTNPYCTLYFTLLNFLTLFYNYDRHGLSQIVVS